MLLFLKLGGSLITDKLKVEHPHVGVLERLAKEVGRACEADQRLRLVLGHGSGSFGHVAAARHDTRRGVRTPHEWRGFADVSAAAARLNKIVLETFRASGAPAITFQPSASAQCRDGQLVNLSTRPVEYALAAGLLPIVHGDVAFDSVRGGTIISTETVMAYLASELRPEWILLAGETHGVMDSSGGIIPLITSQNIEDVRPLLGGSHGTDVTGGMISKVLAMLDLVNVLPDTRILIFSGVPPASVENALLRPGSAEGTVIRLSSKD